MKAFYKLMLKGTVIGSVAFVMAAAGCSSDKTDTAATGGTDNKAGTKGSTAGSPSEAGTGTAGDTTGTGGKSGNTPGGATSGGTNEGGAAGGTPPITSNAGGPDIAFGGDGSGGAGGAGTGPSVGKFCNTLSFGGNDVTMVLEIGEGASKVTFKAVTGTCAPADGHACTMLPQGANVPIVMYDNDDPTTVLDSGSADIAPGEDWILFSDLDKTDPQNPQPIFDGGPLRTATCESILYTDI